MDCSQRFNQLPILISRPCLSTRHQDCNGGQRCLFSERMPFFSTMLLSRSIADPAIFLPAIPCCKGIPARLTLRSRMNSANYRHPLLDHNKVRQWHHLIAAERYRDVPATRWNPVDRADISPALLRCHTGVGRSRLCATYGPRRCFQGALLSECLGQVAQHILLDLARRGFRQLAEHHGFG